MGEVTRTLFETAPLWGENFEVFGSKASYSALSGELWRMESEVKPACRGKHIEKSHPDFPMRWDLLPDAYRNYPPKGCHDDAAMHLVHEFVSSMVEGRKSAIDAVTAANWCAVGICAHESAMNGGTPVNVPSFEE